MNDFWTRIFLKYYTNYRIYLSWKEQVISPFGSLSSEYHPVNVLQPRHSFAFASTAVLEHLASSLTQKPDKDSSVKLVTLKWSQKH